VSTYLNRKSLVGCLFAVGLMGGLSSVALAVENSDHSPLFLLQQRQACNCDKRFEARSRVNGPQQDEP
jgi:hypothetical protein